MSDVTYTHCPECGVEIEIFEDGGRDIYADGWLPIDWDEYGYIFDVPHGDCDNSRITWDK